MTFECSWSMEQLVPKWNCCCGYEYDHAAILIYYLLWFRNRFNTECILPCQNFLPTASTRAHSKMASPLMKGNHQELIFHGQFPIVLCSFMFRYSKCQLNFEMWKVIWCRKLLFVCFVFFVLNGFGLIYRCFRWGKRRLVLVELLTWTELKLLMLKRLSQHS